MLEIGTFDSIWNKTVMSHGDNSFLVFRHHEASSVDESWTYAEFDQLAARTAGRLRKLGVTRGDAVHVCLKNCPAFVMIWLAASRLGAWMVPVDPNSTSRDIAKQIRLTTPKVGVCSAQRSGVYRDAIESNGLPVIEVSETSNDTHKGSPLLGVSIDSVGARPRDRIAVMFTSGTTSDPKGVVLTQANYAYAARKMASLVNQKAEHRWYVCLPLFHANAQYYCFLPAILSGASVAVSSTFTASGWATDVHELEATHASLFAAPIRMIIARSPAAAPKLALRHVWFAQSLAKHQFLKFAEMCGTLPCQLYGMTETTAVVTADLAERPSCDTIGRVVTGRRVRLLDPASLAPVRPGEPGMMFIGGEPGEDLFLEYLNNKAATGAAFGLVDGGLTWFRSGDLARYVDDLNLVFVGRVDDVIKVSGENVSLTEVDAVLAQAPNVLEVATVAVDDPVYDKVPVAYVVPVRKGAGPSDEELSHWAADNLVPAARPRRWIIVDELPRTSVGKIRRFKLKQQAAVDSRH